MSLPPGQSADNGRARPETGRPHAPTPGASVPVAAYGQVVSWSPQVPRFRLLHVLLVWFITAVAVLLAAAIVPGVSVGNFGDAIVAAALIAVLNVVLPPLVAAVQLPFTLAVGFVLILGLDALMLVLASDIDSRSIEVSSFGWALLAAVVISGASAEPSKVSYGPRLASRTDPARALMTRAPRPRQHPRRRSRTSRGLGCRG